MYNRCSRCTLGIVFENSFCVLPWRGKVFLFLTLERCFVSEFLKANFWAQCEQAYLIVSSLWWLYDSDLYNKGKQSNDLHKNDFKVFNDNLGGWEGEKREEAECFSDALTIKPHYQNRHWQWYKQSITMAMAMVLAIDHITMINQYWHWQWCKQSIN